jgi:alkanesulfonate monooxygenase SsuD/methylene tetrahydromethanopterin reductase-like flavin-dependent oxidoreductase (luciferase family)
MTTGTVSIGLTGALDRAFIRDLAPRIEAAGFHALWLNDSPDGNSLQGLSVAADATTTLKLATGVIPLDRRAAEDIIADIRTFELPEDRLIIGIGTGTPKGGLARVATGIADVRREISAPVVIGALGPKIRKLGAEEADGLLLSWLTPDAAASAMEELRLQQSAAGREHVKGHLYVRTAHTSEGLQAMVAEAARYGSIPAYKANFERIGARPIDTTIYETEADRLRHRIHAYTSIVDEVVLRAITGPQTLDAYVRFVEYAAQAI